MISKRNVFLIGPMGSGKTAVGRALAKALDLEFVDSDAEIEHRTGVDIAFIFEKEGEAGFRQRERDVIADLTLRDGIVLATGGGAVVEPDNRRNLAARGCVVYLETSVAQQLERTRHGKHRPLLVTEDPRTKLEDLLRVREPLYREIADIVVRTDGRRVQLLTDEVMRLLERRPTAG
jgi:shikimate kinase